MFCAHSDAMNLDFVYPSSFANSKGTADDAPREEQEHKAPGDKKATHGCVSLPITAMDMRKGFNMIFLIRSDEACFGKEATATERGTAGGTVIYSAASCVASGRNIACSEFLSSDCRTLAVLSASTVKFTHTAATPVISAKLAPACKL